ncbi:hypothetical protein [Brevibacillus sp. SAFN-007a]|uniref:hypothetical protein n=1 Tax=Brevibacillus sp. SAFN-007a TaxID=3436862 RepID=UPI003F81287C
MKKIGWVCILMMLMLTSACGNVEMTSHPNTSSNPKPEADESMTPENTTDYCEDVFTTLDSETEKSFYGTWKVEKLLGFSNSYNDASEYPTGQKIIGDEFIIKKDFFSSKGLKNYTNYQHELKNPLYELNFICYNTISFYRLFKTDPDTLHINNNDKVKYIVLNDSSTNLGIPLSFFMVNNDRLILLLEATHFELKKITD